MAQLYVDVELGGEVRRLALDGNATIAFVDAFQADLHEEIKTLFIEAREAAEEAQEAADDIEELRANGLPVPDPQKSYSLTVLSTGRNMKRLRRIVWGLAVSYRPDLEADPGAGVAEVGRWFSLADMGPLCGAVMECWLHGKTLPKEFEGQLAPFVPTPEAVVEGMLNLAGVAPGQLVIDLGAGDGRLMFGAVGRGALAFGYEMQDERYKALALRIAQHPQSSKLAVFRKDIREADLAEADVVFMYLLQDSNAELKAKLLSECKPGAVVVSHAFDMPDWLPEAQDKVRAINPDTGRRTTHRIYRWRIPARG